MTYQAIYKCRLCNKHFKSQITGQSNVMSCMVYALHGIDDKRIFGVKPELHQIHFCDNDEFGVADFIGFEKYLATDNEVDDEK